MSVPPEAECLALATHQHGVISRTQARERGMTNSMIRRRVQTGRWLPILSGVLRVGGAPDSWESRLAAALLWGGPEAVASHRAAARLWQLEGFEEAPIEILAPRTHPQPGIVLHRIAPSDRMRRCVLHGFPVTAIERTLLDLGAVIPGSALGRTIDEALIRRLTTQARLRAQLDRVGRRGRPGTAALRRALDLRFPQEDRAESHLELRFVRLLRRSGLPLPTPQYEIDFRDGTNVRLDFAYPELKLAIETHGFRFHSTREQLRADARRENRLKRLGWLVLVFTWDDVVGDASRVVAEITEAFAERSEKHSRMG